MDFDILLSYYSSLFNTRRVLILLVKKANYRTNFLFKLVLIFAFFKKNTLFFFIVPNFLDLGVHPFCFFQIMISLLFKLFSQVLIIIRKKSYPFFNHALLTMFWGKKKGRFNLIEGIWNWRVRSHYSKIHNKIKL